MANSNRPSIWLSWLLICVTVFCSHGNATDSQECIRIDAALTRKNNYIYLFHGNEYIKFDQNGKEMRKNSIREFGGLKGSIDAATIWSSGNGNTYFFKGSDYYKLAFLIVGPYKMSSWGSEFSDGIDAAGNRDGKTYFFKGCSVFSIVQEGKARTIDETFDSKIIGLPCNVDAAFSKDDVLYIIIGDEVYEWGQDVEGPFPLSKVLNVTSWNICPNDNDE